MRKKVRIIHPFTKRKQTGSSLLKKQKLEIALNVLGSRLESLGKCCQKLPGSSTDLQGTELSLGPGVRKDSQVNPCLFSCEMIERMCWPILSLWLSLKKVWYVWYDAFLQFYRSFYPKENTYNLCTFSHRIRPFQHLLRTQNDLEVGIWDVSLRYCSSWLRYHGWACFIAEVDRDAQKKWCSGKEDS